ncbi:HTH-type transcriptional regulator MalT [compost metagenome]
MTVMRLSPECSARLPRLSPRHLPRMRLSAHLLAAPERVKLLCAPLGSGKTALLVECAQQAPAGCAVHWLSLGDAAMGTRQAFCAALASTLGMASASEDQVIEHLAQVHTATWVFLDDYGRSVDSSLDALLDALLLHSSAHIDWWIGSRRRPSCHWPRLLLNGDLLEFDGRDLAFTAEEIDLLLDGQLHERPQHTASRTFELTDGWAAGVRIALLDVADGGPLQMGSVTLSAYLEHELFGGLPAELGEVWRVLATLPRFDASLCEHLFGAGEGAAALRQLQTLGCFIEPWEHSARWLQVFPPLARHQRLASNPVGRSWHRRACQWFTLQGDWQMAFEQACAAREYEAAISLLQHLQVEHLYERQNVVLLVDLHSQDQALSYGDPQWISLIAGALLIAGRFDEAQASIDQLTRFLPASSAAAQQQLIALWQALRGWLLHLQGRAKLACEYLQVALAHLPDANWQLRLTCFSGLIQQALLRGELNHAQTYLRDALCLARAEGSVLLEVVLELDHAQLLEQRGALRRAQSLLVKTQELLEARHCHTGLLAGRIALRLGRLSARLGQDAAAAAYYGQGLQMCLQSQDKRALYGYLGLATLEAAQDRYAEAFVRLREAERLMQLHHVPELVYRGVLLLVSSYFWLQQGRAGLARETLARVLRHFRGPQAVQAPPATLELIPRLEALLVLAEVHLQQATAPLSQLQALVDHARISGMQALEAELYLVMAEAAFISSEHGIARDCLDKGMTLCARLELVQPVNELRLRHPGLLEASGLNVTEPLITEDNPLSQRELEVLTLIAQGNSNQQIAEQLFISLHTVKTHMRRIHSKLGVERRTQAVAIAKKIGLMS